MKAVHTTLSFAPRRSNPRSVGEGEKVEPILGRERTDLNGFIEPSVAPLPQSWRHSIGSGWTCSHALTSVDASRLVPSHPLDFIRLGEAKCLVFFPGMDLGIDVKLAMLENTSRS